MADHAGLTQCRQFQPDRRKPRQGLKAGSIQRAARDCTGIGINHGRNFIFHHQRQHQALAVGRALSLS